MNHASFRAAFFQKLGSSDQVFALFDLVPELSFFAKDRQGRFVALNQRGCEYCGVAQKNLAIGKTDHDFFPKPRADEYQADDQAVIESGEAIINRIESAPEPAGSPRLVMTSKVPLRDTKGRVIGVAGFSRPIERTREQTGDATSFGRVMEHLQTHFDQNPSTIFLAKMAGLSVSQFERRFRRAFGASPHQYLIRVRIEHACRLLVDTNQTVSEVAQACGFYDHAHFSRRFRRLMNVTPSKYRSQSRDIASS
ncbi:MAG: AraC family transcriptional regulator [Planctomycetota bacterium]